MRSETLLLLWCYLALAPASARPSSGERIVGGYPASVGQFPHQVLISGLGYTRCHSKLARLERPI